jgi:hypothetical protein
VGVVQTVQASVTEKKMSNTNVQGAKPITVNVFVARGLTNEIVNNLTAMENTKVYLSYPLGRQNDCTLGRLSNAEGAFDIEETWRSEPNKSLGHMVKVMNDCVKYILQDTGFQKFCHQHQEYLSVLKLFDGEPDRKQFDQQFPQASFSVESEDCKDLEFKRSVHRFQDRIYMPVQDVLNLVLSLFGYMGLEQTSSIKDLVFMLMATTDPTLLHTLCIPKTLVIDPAATETNLCLLALLSYKFQLHGFNLKINGVVAPQTDFYSKLTGVEHVEVIV